MPDPATIGLILSGLNAAQGAGAQKQAGAANSLASSIGGIGGSPLAGGAGLGPLEALFAQLQNASSIPQSLAGLGGAPSPLGGIA